MATPNAQAAARRSLIFVLSLLVGLPALFLFPYLFQGRSMLPLELMAVFQPWAEHTGELWGSVPSVHNPLVDSLQQYYPRRAYMTEALQGGWLPFWNPNVYGGSPFHASQQGAVLYPPAWALALFPPEMQFGWSAFFHLSLAAGGTFLFLRRMGLRSAAAVCGGVAFAFNGYGIVWLAYPNVAQWTLAWLPLALYCWERGRRADDLRWLAASGGALALNLLGGHAQSSAYVLLAWGAWAMVRTTLLVRAPAPNASAALRRVARWLALPAVLAVLLSLGHLLPALELAPRTDRGERITWEQAAGAGMPAAQLWTLFLPRLFGDGTSEFALGFWMPEGGKAALTFVERSFYPGIAVLVLACGALALPRQRGRGTGGPRGRGTGVPHEGEMERDWRLLAWFSLGLTLLGVLLAMGTPLYWPLWRFAPGFGQFTAVARIVCVSAWGLACLAALGVQALGAADTETRTRAFRGVAAAAVGAALVAGLGHFIYGGAAPDAVRQYLAQHGRSGADALAGRDLFLALLWCGLAAALAFLAWRGWLKPAAVGTAAALVVAADLFAFGWGFNPKTDPRLARGYTSELGFLQAETVRAREEGLPFRFLSVGPPGSEFDFRKRMPSNLPSTLGLADMLGSDSFVTRRYRAWEEALGRANGGAPWSRPGAVNLRAAAVRYYLSGPAGAGKRLPLAPVLTTPEEHTLRIDAQALPYARLHTNVQALTRSELLENLALPNRAPVFALTSGPDAPVFNGRPAVTPFRVRRVNGNRLVVEGEAPEPGLLLVCEQYDPAWRARVNGRPARVAPADHLFVGVPLPAGRCRVELTYAPSSYRVGAFGMLAALALVCALLCGARGRVGT